MEGEADLVKAEDILADILAGKPIKYGIEDGPISGNLNLEQLKDDEGRVHIPVPIEITNLAIGPGVNFGNAIFEEAVCFKGSTFGKSEIDFCGACFRKMADFSETTLGAPNFSKAEFYLSANFKKVKFVGEGEINFTDARFHHEADFSESWLGDHNTRAIVFEGAKFKGHTYFRNARFNGDTYFRGTKFGGEAIFDDATFSVHVRFWEAEFGDCARFWGVKFNKDASFGRTKFGGYAGFKSNPLTGEEIHFDGVAEFPQTEFGGDAEFSKAQFSKDADFQGAKFSGEADLFQAKFDGDVYFYSAQFHKTLDLSKLRFERLYVSWDSIKNRLCYHGKNRIDGPTQLALIKNFKLIEQFDDADDCYYKYRRESQRGKSWLDCSKYLDIISWVFCGYGVRLKPIIGCVFGSILVFSVFYGIFSKYYGGIARDVPSTTTTMAALNNSTLLLAFTTNNIRFTLSWWELFYFSAMAFLGVTSEGLHPIGGICKFAIMIEGILGYFLLALFVVVLARKLIR